MIKTFIDKLLGKGPKAAPQALPPEEIILPAGHRLVREARTAAAGGAAAPQAVRISSVQHFAPPPPLSSSVVSTGMGR